MKRKSSKEVKADLNKREEEILDKFDQLDLEKNDSTAMIFAAIITFLPVVLGIFAVVAIVLWLIVK